MGYIRSTKHRVYVASSWRNARQPAVVEALREDGHTVYDFRNPVPGDNGFSWRDIGDRATWTPEDFSKVLDHPVSQHGFDLDMQALRAASVVVLVLPCGRSAHLEHGFAVGTGKMTIVYQEELDETELMYRMCDYYLTNLRDVRNTLVRSKRKRPRWQHDLSRVGGVGKQFEGLYLSRVGGVGKQFEGLIPSTLTETRYRSPDEVLRDEKTFGGPLPKKGPCAEYTHRPCTVCGGCWRHGACTCDLP